MTNDDFTFFTQSSNRWILQIEPSGKIILNPEIPQDEAARDFVMLCNTYASKKIERLQDRLQTQKGVIANHIENERQLQGNLSLAEEGLANATDEVSVAKDYILQQTEVIDAHKAEIERLRNDVARLTTSLSVEVTESERLRILIRSMVIECDEGMPAKAAWLARRNGDAASPDDEPRAAPQQDIGQLAWNDDPRNHALNCPCEVCKANPMKQILRDQAARAQSEKSTGLSQEIEGAQRTMSEMPDGLKRSLGVKSSEAPVMAADQVCERHGTKGCTHPFCVGY